MNTDPAQRLQMAEARLQDALQRLHALRREAILGNYDPIVFDRALAAYVKAQEEARNARSAHADPSPAPATPLVPVAHAVPVAPLISAAPPVPATPPAAIPEGVAPAEPTNRLRFVRWLVQTGRLSDGA